MEFTQILETEMVLKYVKSTGHHLSRFLSISPDTAQHAATIAGF